ncbi:MAG: DUF2306 domain-containing protein [Crocinitomicaceae bacterium]|nr:DUF2306 domain-containing protein [Crocinitomicaceae bacterium]
MTIALKYTLWAVIAFCSLFLAYITALYFSFDTNLNFLNVKQSLISNNFWMTSFYIHVGTGILVMLIGPFQFLKWLRNKYLEVHRIIGRIYVFTILGFAAPTGLIMAFYAEGGLWSTIGFSLMSITWFLTTYLAVVAAKNKKIRSHEKWMYRSYAMSFSAVTLRLLVPAMSIPNFGFSDHFVVVSTAWISWLINLIIIELYLKIKFKSLT